MQKSDRYKNETQVSPQGQKYHAIFNKLHGKWQIVSLLFRKSLFR